MSVQTPPSSSPAAEGRPLRTAADRQSSPSRPSSPSRAAADLTPRRLWLRGLERPGLAFAHVPPNWFAAVMGTGIVATAAASLPLQLPGQRAAATAVWALAAVLLAGVVLATALHWVRHPEAARGHHRHPVTAHFYGAPPMALLTVGAGSLLLGRDWLGEGAAVDLAWVLWGAGTVLGLLGAAAIPCLLAARRMYRPEEAFGGWLMPVVPPMVSASAGALLLPHAPAGLPREALLWGCYGLFALSLAASLLVTSLIVRRLVRHGVGAPGAVPTLWIVLGFAGQSATAVNLLADRAPLAVDDAVAGSLLRFAVVYGSIALGFGLLWTALALTITLRTARRGLPFSLTWWSFTFPVGTCATGFSALAGHIGLPVVRALAVLYFAGLVAAWCVVAARTVHGVAVRGDLLLPPR